MPQADSIMISIAKGRLILFSFPLKPPVLIIFYFVASIQNPSIGLQMDMPRKDAQVFLLYCSFLPHNYEIVTESSFFSKDFLYLICHEVVTKRRTYALLDKMTPK
jgi:hypothetical protein